MRNKIKVALVVIITTAVALPALCAGKNMSTTLERSIVQAAAAQEIPLETFKAKIQNVPNPQDANRLLAALEKLTAYNESFETEKNIQKLSTLANELEGPFAVPWSCEEYGLKEIFDNYVPNSHGNQKVAKLEYYVKLYTLSPDTRSMASYLTSKSSPAYFVQAYNNLKDTVAMQEQRDDKELFEALTQLARAYHKLANQDGIKAREVKVFLFDMPIQTGWNRTFSVKELVLQLGIKKDPDGFQFRSAEQIQRQTNADLTEIEDVFMPFVRLVFW